MDASGVAGAIWGIGRDALNYTLNEQSAQRQRDWNKDMYILDRSYNSPEEQVKRLRKAGLNPSLMAQNGAIGSGNTSAPPSSVTQPTHDLRSPETLAEGLRLDNETRMAKAQVSKTEAETQAQTIRNKFEMFQQLASLRKTIREGNLSEAEAKRMTREADYLSEQIVHYGDIADSQVAMNQATARLNDATAALKELELKFAPDQWQKILRNLDKQGVEIDSRIRMNDSQGALNAALKAVEDARKEGINIDNNNAKAVSQAYIDQKQAESDKAFFEAQQQGRNYYEGEAVGRTMPAYVLDGNGFWIYTRDGRKYIEPSRIEKKRNHRRDLDHVK